MEQIRVFDTETDSYIMQIGNKETINIIEKGEEDEIFTFYILFARAGLRRFFRTRGSDGIGPNTKKVYQTVFHTEIRMNTTRPKWYWPCSMKTLRQRRKKVPGSQALRRKMFRSQKKMMIFIGKMAAFVSNRAVAGRTRTRRSILTCRKSGRATSPVT